MSSTTLTSWALLIWKALLANGLDSHAIFKRSGLDPALLGDGNARYRISDMANLWQVVVDETNDPCFGLEVGKGWSATTFHALGFAWLASESLKDALKRLVRYANIVNNSLNIMIETRGGSLHFILNTTEDKKFVHYAANDAGLTALIVMCRLLCGESFTPVKIEMQRKPLQCVGRLEAFFRSPVEYNCKNNVIVFDRKQIEQKLATGNTQLIRINEEAVSSYLQKLERSSFSLQVKAKLIESLPAGNVSEEQIAGSLNVSLRTLQRKLVAEHTSFSKIVRSVRQDMANNYIQDSQLSINEIAYLLGFSEQANFTRAFRRWYGASPSEYRKNLKQASVK